jgi:hypothetical protein
MDLAGRPSMPAGLTGQVFAALPTPEVAGGWRSPLPSTSWSNATLHSDTADILHGLPMPEILPPDRRMAATEADPAISDALETDLYDIVMVRRLLYVDASGPVPVVPAIFAQTPVRGWPGHA